MVADPPRTCGRSCCYPIRATLNIDVGPVAMAKVDDRRRVFSNALADKILI